MENRLTVFFSVFSGGGGNSLYGILSLMVVPIAIPAVPAVFGIDWLLNRKFDHHDRVDGGPGQVYFCENVSAFQIGMKIMRSGDVAPLLATEAIIDDGLKRVTGFVSS